MKKLQLFTIIILILSPFTIIKAQFDRQLSQYYMAKGYYNPAFAGISGNINLLGASRLQWLGVEGAPNTFFVTADMPFTLNKQTIGLGALLNTETIGLFNHTQISAQLAYHYKIWGGRLSGGLQIGIINESFDGTKINTPKTNEHKAIDETLPTTSVSGAGFDLGAGLFFVHPLFYVGIGTTHINEPELQLEEKYYLYMARHYNFMASYNIKLKNSFLELKPSIFVLTNMNSYYTDISTRLIYNKMFMGGLSYRVNNSVGLLLGATFGSFQVGYAYDFPTTAIAGATSGSHELMVRYTLKWNKTKTGKKKYKSVRIL